MPVLWHKKTQNCTLVLKLNFHIYIYILKGIYWVWYQSGKAGPNPGLSLGTLVLQKCCICLLQMINCDKLKHTRVAHPGIHKIFNWIFLSILVKCLRMYRCICIEDIIKWLMLFCISSSLTWAPSLGIQTRVLAFESLWIPHWKGNKLH